jgi:ribonucleotide reductase beta subunit family protein with ferritin-like domain
MFAVFGATELGVHAPFYAKINELLGLNTNEFYTSYVDNPTLKGRKDHIEAIVGIPINTEEDALLSIGAFSIVEGAILYSNFAFLKHFQAEGKNKLTNLVAGINFSVRDENLHSLGGAWVFNELLKESSLTDKEKERLRDNLVKFCHQLKEHEGEIIEMIFERGAIRGITEVQLKNFVDARLNLCLNQLGYENLYTITYDPISKWFYKNIQSSQLHDFFVKVGNAYNRDWEEKGFTWICQ